MSNFQSKLGATLVTSVAATGVLFATPNIAEASFGTKTLSFGMQDPDVVILQERLMEEGFFQYHTATGYFGQITRQAVQDYQKAHHLKTDGIVGSKTFSVLNGEQIQKNSRSSASSNTVTVNSAEKLRAGQVLRPGAKGPEVVKLQAFLKNEGFFDYHTATGNYGTITEQSVRQYQRDRGLKVDGITGPQTIGQINREISGQSNKQSDSSSTGSSASSSKNSSGSQSSSSSAPSQVQGMSQLKTGQVLRPGTRGNEVTKLQNYLKKSGFFDYHTATGYYGSVTEQAVRNFQRARGLKVDGITGPQTIGAINKEIKNTDTSESTGSSNKESGSTGNKDSSKNSNSSSSSDEHVANPAPISLDELIRSSINLRQGNQGPPVRTLQIYLDQLGFYDHRITGDFGPITAKAVRDFQKSAKIKVDGIAGPQTFRAIQSEVGQSVGEEQTDSGNDKGNSSEEAPPSENSDSSSGQSSKVLLQEGSRGDSVTELQHRLKVLGHFNQDPTGYFGPVTKEAVKKFQKQWDLLADGRVSQATWNKLEETSNIYLEDAETKPAETFDVMNLVADAATYIGTPYQWGGMTPSGFDCSGFIQYLFKKNNVHLPRTVAEQWNATKAVSKPKVGDIVYFETYKDGPSHNGVYIGNNQFIHSGSSNGVTIGNLNWDYWSSRYLGAREHKIDL